MKNSAISWVTVGTACVCALVMLFTGFAMHSASVIANQAEQMHTHPYIVKSETHAMRTRLMEMRLYLLPLLLSEDKDHPDRLYQMLAERDEKQDASLWIIKGHYLGSSKDIVDLEAALNAVRKARRQAVENRNAFTTPDEILAYLDLHVYPQSNDVDVVLQRIMDTADRKVLLFRQSADTTRNILNIGALLLCTALIALVVFITINEQRKNKAIAYRDQLFTLLSNSIDDVFFIYNCETASLEYASENSGRMLGISSSDLQHKFGANDQKAGDGSLKNLLHGLHEAMLEQEVSERELKFNKNGQTLDLKLSHYPIPVNGKPWRVICVLSDQTRMVAQQAALSDALFTARKVNDAKQEFLSRMSHEIRTPMNAIIGMTAIAGRYADDKERVADCLSKISASSRHLLSLINDVLDIAKIEGGKLSISHGPFNIRNFLSTLTAIIYPQATAHQQSFEITLTGDVEESLIGDELRLNQILINLLSNAIKFTPSGGEIRLEITRLQNKSGKALLRFVVRDTGIGMSKTFIDRLYTPFEQADNIAQNYGGTGLGLSITQNLVSLMYGSIAVHSEEGKGTSFTVELPFVLPESTPSAPSADFSNLNVLVVDDDQITCEHAMTLLEQLGTKGDWANSGFEAVKKVTRASDTGMGYDACFIDWRMPGMDGLETARRLRRQVGPDKPIIIISSYDLTAIEEEAHQAGVNAFISKPLFASSLYSVLSSVQAQENSPYDRVSETRIVAADNAAPREDDYDFSGKKILLVEDNPINQEIALELLQLSHFVVDCANDGLEALDKFQRSSLNEYDLILMDVQMPKMDGYQATRAIRLMERPDAKTVPILAMTANAFNSDVVAAREAGMDGHLSKPVDVAVMLSTIAHHLGGGATEALPGTSLFKPVETPFFYSSGETPH